MSWPYATQRWKRLRLAHLALEPECRGCKARGRLTLANTVDHIVPVSEGGPAFPGHDGLASYCPACHSAKTARGAEAGAIRSNKPRKGCHPDGSPLDPDHPWHAGTRCADPAPTRAAPKSLRAEPRKATLNRGNQLVSGGRHG